MHRLRLIAGDEEVLRIRRYTGEHPEVALGEILAFVDEDVRPLRGQRKLLLGFDRALDVFRTC